jgi:hypothetical protein
VWEYRIFTARSESSCYSALKWPPGCVCRVTANIWILGTHVWSLTFTSLVQELRTVCLFLSLKRLAAVISEIYRRIKCSSAHLPLTNQSETSFPCYVNALPPYRTIHTWYWAQIQAAREYLHIKLLQYVCCLGIMLMLNRGTCLSAVGVAGGWHGQCYEHHVHLIWNTVTLTSQRTRFLSRNKQQCFYKQHSTFGRCNGDCECLLRGTNWIVLYCVWSWT